MIKIKIRKNPVLQEAMKLEGMGLPAILITSIKEDLTKREDQVRLALMLKDEPISLRAAMKASKLFDWNGHNPWVGNFYKQMEKKYLNHDIGMKEFKGFYDKYSNYFVNHKAVAMSGEYYWKSKLQNPDRPSPFWVRNGVDSTRPLKLKDLKGMRKSVAKFIKKNDELSTEHYTKKFNDEMDGTILEFYNDKIRGSGSGSKLIAFLKEHPDNQQSLAGMGLKEAVEFAEGYFNEKEDPDNIIKDYGNGFFWYNIGEDSCSVEAARMGHCGSADRGILFSLRSKGRKQKISDSHITISFDGGEVFQIKGKQNCTPDEKYGKYIIDFLKFMEVEVIHESGQHSSCDFGPFLEWLQEKYPEAEYPGNMEEELMQTINAINNGNYNTEYVEFYSDWVDDPHIGRPQIYIDAEAFFRVELPFLNDLDWEFVADIYNDEEEKLKELIVEACDFEDYDVYSDAIDIHLREGEFSDEGLMLDVRLRLSPDNNNYAESQEEAEGNIRNIYYGYEGDNIEDHQKKIQTVFMREYDDVINPAGREEFQGVLERIEELKQQYKFFDVYVDDESEEISMEAKIPLPIRFKFIQNAGRYSRDQIGRAINTYWQKLETIFPAKTITKDIEKAMDDRHDKIKAAAEKQVQIPFPGFEVEKPHQGKLKKPFSFEMGIKRPSTAALSGAIKGAEWLVPKLAMGMMISWLDNKDTILYVMEYIDFLEDEIENIINGLPLDRMQREVNAAHKEAVSSLPNYTQLSENRKRRRKIKIIK